MLLFNGVHGYGRNTKRIENQPVVPLEGLISHLEPINPAYMDLYFELEEIGNISFEKEDFEHEINLGVSQYCNVLADK